MIRALRVVVALAALLVSCAAAPAHAQEPASPPCGTIDKPAPCVSLTTGAVTVMTRGERREYMTVGVSLEAPLPAGLSAFAHGDMFGVQDAGSLNGDPQSFRAIKLEAGVGKRAGVFLFNARGGATFSIEGQVGAPVQARAFDALVEAQLRLQDGGHLALRGGYEATVGGWSIGGDVDIPVDGAPSIVARYDLPLVRDAHGQLPWVLTAGGRIRVKSFRLAIK
jgi:hypothetical protein